MKHLLVPAALAASTLFSLSAAAELSANIGYASEYYYRGILQAESSASAGIDYEQAGFYAGAWTADVGDGLEVDIYGGYGLEVGGVGLSVGFTSYQYTGEFDTEYNELNFGATFGMFSLDIAPGQHECGYGDADDVLAEGADEDAAEYCKDGDDEDYTYYALTFEKDGFYAKYAGFTQDWEGDYIELGYGAEIGGFDAGITLIFSQADLGPKGRGWVGDDDEAIVFSIGKSFDL